MKPLIEPKACDNIEEIRDSIDLIDQEILHLLATRLEYVKEIVKFKIADEESIIARERREVVLSQRKEWALENGLDPELMEKVFKLLIDKNIQIQLDIYKSNSK